MDNANESPLDVLSRAATMVQNNVLPPSYSEYWFLVIYNFLKMYFIFIFLAETCPVNRYNRLVRLYGIL